MDAKQAYQIIKKHHPNEVCIICTDFGDFFGFNFVPPEAVSWGDFGGACDTVDKKTGEISVFNPIINLSLLDNAKIIDPASLEQNLDEDNPKCPSAGKP